MAYIGDVNSGQKPSTKRYAIIALVLVAVAIASMFFAKGSLDSRGHFTGPLVENGLKLYSGWNLISVPYSNVSIQKEGCNIIKINYYNSSLGEYQKIDSLSYLKPGLGYWIYSDATCRLSFSETTEMISNGGDSSVSGYDTNIYRGKIFTKNTLGKDVPIGVIKQICVYGNAISDATLTIRKNETSSDLYEVKVNTDKGWKCTDTNFEWNYSSLFIYKKSGNAAISYSGSTPYDSRYSYDSGKTWSSDTWRRGIKFNITATKDANVSDIPELKKGWNIIGSLTEATTLSSISKECDIGLVYTYDAQYKAFSLSKTLEPGKAYWIYVKNNCKLKQETIPTADTNTENVLAEISNSGDSINEYDTTSYRGKLFTTEINGNDVPSGTIKKVCVQSNGKSSVVLGIRSDITQEELNEVTVYTDNGWRCADTNILWSSSKLFIYKKSGAGVITASPTAPYDSYYSDNNGKTWSKDPGTKRRSIKVYISTTNRGLWPIATEIPPIGTASSTDSGAITITATSTIALVLNDKNGLSEIENDFYDGLKNDGSKPDVLSYSDATLANLKQYKKIFVLQYSDKLKGSDIIDAYNSGVEVTLIGTASKYMDSANIQDVQIASAAPIQNTLTKNFVKGSLSAERTVSSYSGHTENNYAQQTPTVDFTKRDIISDIDRLKSGDNGGGFTPVGLVRDDDNNLYMTYNYPIFSKYKGEYSGHDWVNKPEKQPYNGYTLTFGVGVAISKDEGQTWQLVAKSEDSHEVKGPIFNEVVYKDEPENVKRCDDEKNTRIAKLEKGITAIKNYLVTHPNSQEYITSLANTEKTLDTEKARDCNPDIYGQFYQDDLSEVDYQGIVPNSNGGVDVYYSLFYTNRQAYVGPRISSTNSRMYDVLKQMNSNIYISLPKQLAAKGYKPYEDIENSYQLHVIHISGNNVNDAKVFSTETHNQIDEDIRFVDSNNGKRFFVEGDNLYYSEDNVAEELIEYGLKGFSDGKSIFQMQEYLYGGDANGKPIIIGYYNGSLYKSDGSSFVFVKYIGTEEQRKKMSNFARETSYPLMQFDDQGNLHIIIMDKHTQNSDLFGWHTSPGLEADLVYQFIPASTFDASKKKDISTVYFFYPSGCTKCSEFSQFIKDGGISVNENPSGDEFKAFRDSKQIITVVKKDGGYDTIYGLNKIKVAKYLAIEIKQIFIDTYSPLLRTPGKRAETPSDEIDVPGTFYFTENSMPSLAYETSEGVVQYYYSLDSWKKREIAKVNVTSYPIRSPDYLMMEPFILFSQNEKDGKIDFLVFTAREGAGIKYDDSESPTYNYDVKAYDKYGSWTVNQNVRSRGLIFYDKTDTNNQKTYKLFNRSNYGALNDYPIINRKIWTNEFVYRVSGYEHEDLEYPYYTNYYDFYTTKSYSPPSAQATATQVKPITEILLSLKGQTLSQGAKVVGQLSEYVTSEEVVTKNEKQYYKINVDLNKKGLKAVDGHINSKTVKGFLKLESGYATFTLKIVDKTLGITSYESPENNIDISMLSTKITDGQWMVVNNLAVPNNICGNEITSNSYKKISVSDASCVKQFETGYQSIGYCDDWERVTNDIQNQIMLVYQSSLPEISKGEKIVYPVTYMVFPVDDWVDLEDIEEVGEAIAVGTCKIPTLGMDSVLVGFKPSFIKDFEKPTWKIEVTKVA